MGHVSSLVRSEVDLARAEIGENVNRAGLAFGLLLGAVVIALVALNVLAAALVAAIAEAGLEAGWAALIVGAVLAVIALAMTVKATKDLKLANLAPTRTARNMKRDAAALKDAYNDK
jgi:hypothetical protein